MAIDVGQTRATTTYAPDASEAEASFRYSMFGVLVRSDIRLPIAPLPESDRMSPAWIIKRIRQAAAPATSGTLVEETRCVGPCHGGSIVIRVIRGRGGTWIWHQDFGLICHIPTDARRVDVYPKAGADERALGLLLAGPVSVFLLHQHGCPSLHASAVMTESGVLAFLGPKGKGKSTMAACFLRRGAALVTDDILPLRVSNEGVDGGPGLAIMKVWPDTATHTLELCEELPKVTARLDKRLLTLDGNHTFAETPARVRALYVLDRYDPHATGRTDIGIRTLAGREALHTLLNQVSYGAFLQPSERARFLPHYTRLLAQAPLRVLSYPQGFEHQESVHERILADLERR